jgi:hypothetical protein
MQNKITPKDHQNKIKYAFKNPQSYPLSRWEIIKDRPHRI